ncbi:hypothetical protein LJW16_002723 [Salmonella enterica]|nr:hypothetical protein [Salmonella enterica]
MSLTDGYISERQCGEPVCAGRREREDTGLPVGRAMLNEPKDFLSNLDPDEELLFL